MRHNPGEQQQRTHRSNAMTCLELYLDKITHQNCADKGSRWHWKNSLCAEVHSCTIHNRNVFDDITKRSLLSKIKDRFQINSSKHVSLSELHQRAVDTALQSKNGHLDLFLQFLLGLSVESNQGLLQRLMTQTRNSSERNEETVEHIKKRIRSSRSPKKSINLFHCLNELNDHSINEEIQQYLKSGTLAEAKLTSLQWSALVFVLLTSEQMMDVFELHKFVERENASDKVVRKLLPVIKESRSVKSSHLYLYSAFNNTNCVKATAQYQNRKIVSM